MISLASLVTCHSSPVTAAAAAGRCHILPAQSMQRDRRLRLARRLRLYRLRIRAYAGIVACLMAISLWPQDESGPIERNDRYVRSLPEGCVGSLHSDLLECRYRLADGSWIYSRGY